MNNLAHGIPGFERNVDRKGENQQHCQRTVIQLDKEEMAHREHEHAETQDRERQLREKYQSVPHQGNTSAIPLHQPVASRLPSTIHNPGGILANHNDMQSSGSLGAPNGSGNTFSGSSHNDVNRSIPHNPQSSTNQIQSQPGPNFASNIMHHNPVSGPIINSMGFGGQLQQHQDSSRLQQTVPFNTPTTQGHQLSGGPTLSQVNQQPILNPR